MPLHVTDDEVRRVAEAYFGERGRWAYVAFDWINAHLFERQLPLPFIAWEITAHGGCLGLTHSSDAPPVITLHPSLLGGTESVTPWGIDAAELGWAKAFDVLIHEAMHVSVGYRLRYVTKKSQTSHNNPAWLAEVERIAPKIGLAGLVAAPSRTKRVRDDEGRSRVVRSCAAGVPFKALATFPGGVRRHLGQTDCYRQKRLPFAWEGCNPW